MSEIFEKVNKIDNDLEAREKRETKLILAGKKPEGFEPSMSKFDIFGPVVFIFVMIVAMFYLSRIIGG